MKISSFTDIWKRVSIKDFSKAQRNIMSYLISTAADKQLIRQYTGMCFVAQLSEEMLSFFIDSQEAEIMRTAGLEFYNKQVTEHYDGDGGKWLSLRHYPLTSVDSIEIDYQSFNGSCYHVYYDNASIYLVDGYWPENVHNVHVTYTYGCPLINDANVFNLAKSIVFKSVCKDVLLNRGVADTSGIESEKLEQYSVTYGKGPFAMTIEQLDKDIEKAYKQLGITVEAMII